MFGTFHLVRSNTWSHPSFFASSPLAERISLPPVYCLHHHTHRRCKPFHMPRRFTKMQAKRTGAKGDWAPLKRFVALCSSPQGSGDGTTPHVSLSNRCTDPILRSPHRLHSSQPLPLHNAPSVHRRNQVVGCTCGAWECISTPFHMHLVPSPTICIADGPGAPLQCTCTEGFRFSPRRCKCLSPQGHAPAFH